MAIETKNLKFKHDKSKTLTIAEIAEMCGISPEVLPPPTTFYKHTKQKHYFWGYILGFALGFIAGALSIIIMAKM